MSELTIESLMDLLPEVFLPQNARGIAAVINFVLSGDGGGDWAVIIRDQTCTVNTAKVANPDLTLYAKTQDILDLFTGKLDATRALLFGKLKMDGDMRLAMKLVDLFDTKDQRLRQWRQ